LIASYNASVVKIYSATKSTARFYHENYFALIYNAGVVAVNSKVVGPGHPVFLISGFFSISGDRHDIVDNPFQTD
jgi:hypothetical protein